MITQIREAQQIFMNLDFSGEYDAYAATVESLAMDLGKSIEETYELVENGPVL